MNAGEGSMQKNRVGDLKADHPPFDWLCHSDSFLSY